MINDSKDNFKLFQRLIECMNSVHYYTYLELVTEYNEVYKMNLISIITHTKNNVLDNIKPYGKVVWYTYDEFFKWLIMYNNELKYVTFLRKDISLEEIDLQLIIRGFNEVKFG